GQPASHASEPGWGKLLRRGCGSDGCWAWAGWPGEEKGRWDAGGWRASPLPRRGGVPLALLGKEGEKITTSRNSSEGIRGEGREKKEEIKKRKRKGMGMRGRKEGRKEEKGKNEVKSEEKIREGKLRERRKKEGDGNERKEGRKRERKKGWKKKGKGRKEKRRREEGRWKEGKEGRKGKKPILFINLPPECKKSPFRFDLKEEREQPAGSTLASACHSEINIWANKRSLSAFSQCLPADSDIPAYLRFGGRFGEVETSLEIRINLEPNLALFSLEGSKKLASLEGLRLFGNASKFLELLSPMLFLGTESMPGLFGIGGAKKELGRWGGVGERKELNALLNYFCKPKYFSFPLQISTCFAAPALPEWFLLQSGNPLLQPVKSTGKPNSLNNQVTNLSTAVIDLTTVARKVIKRVKLTSQMEIEWLMGLGVPLSCLERAPLISLKNMAAFLEAQS
ncbi:Pxr1, partial [Ophiophagus hannah]